MPAPTPGYVRNIIRRCFHEQIDKSPTKSQVDKIWAYFHNSCAYCGKLLNRSNKEGHVDHLVSASRGGANNISNRVLSCAKCNEKEKLDKDWKKFLKRKVADNSIRKERIIKIEQWIKTQGSEHLIVSEELLQKVDKLAGDAVKEFTSGIEKIRSMK